MTGTSKEALNKSCCLYLICRWTRKLRLCYTSPSFCQRHKNGLPHVVQQRHAHHKINKDHLDNYGTRALCSKNTCKSWSNLPAWANFHPFAFQVLCADRTCGRKVGKGFTGKSPYIRDHVLKSRGVSEVPFMLFWIPKGAMIRNLL